MIPIGLLESGSKAQFFADPAKKGENIRSGQGNGVLTRLRELGLLPGQCFEVIQNKGRGPLLLKVDGSRIALGRSISMKLQAKLV